MTTALTHPTPATAPLKSEALDLCPGKIQREHQDRLAVVYIRQSTAQQVLNHQESTRLQYGLRSRAVQHGWAEERVLVIDDDLGKSGASAEGRAGFQRLVSEVSLDHVGIIFGIEMSRLARSCKDWHQLIEMCALRGTLIADLDGIYDPAQYNDRLLLGLKGTMSEAELHILKQRMYQGKLSKARRGELHFPVPVGYFRRPSGEVVLDLDEQAQNVVGLVFRKFEELGTINAVLRYFARNEILLGFRVRTGLCTGEIEWRRPKRRMFHAMLTNPIYAGAYAYGRRQINVRRKQPGRPTTGRVAKPRSEWTALIQSRFPAYISWEQHETNLARLEANRPHVGERSPVRHGSALLAGLLVCAKCGCGMHVHYGKPGSALRYVCTTLSMTSGQPLCQNLAANGIEKAVTAEVLRAIEPAGVELSLEASKNVEAQREELSRLWHERLERAGYQSQRASRQYHLVDPENRLVARQLEREWEEKLREQKQLEEDHRRYERDQPRGLSQSEREEIRRLAEDIPALWNASSTTNAERKEIIRQVIDQVVVEIQGTSERVKLRIEWTGGLVTECDAIRSVGKLGQLSYFKALCDRVRALVAEGADVEEIVQRLRREGYRSPRQRSFGAGGVKRIMRRLELCPRRTPKPTRPRLKKNEWWLQDLSRQLSIPEQTFYNRLRRGWVKGRKEGSSKHWILWADADEMKRLREQHRRPSGYYSRRPVDNAPPEGPLPVEETNVQS